MNNLYFLPFIFVSTLYGDDGIFTNQELLLSFALFLAVFLYGYILRLFKRLENLNKNLEAKTIELNESKERLELALKIGKLGCWDVDFTTGKLVVNDEWLRVVGYEISKNEIFTNETWVNTIHPDDRNRVLDYGKEYKNGFIDEYNLEYRGITNDNKTIWLRSKGAIVQRDEKRKPIRMIGVVSDITKDKLLNDSLQQAKMKAEEAVKMKSAFLANMSHEIRTPLNAIIGFIELLKEQEIDENKHKYLNIVSSSSKNLVDIINDILDFSKMESGKINLEYINFNSYEEFDMTKKLFQARADEKEIKLHLDYGNIPKFIKSDILRIKQIVNNLLSNAIKFTPDGKNIYLSMSYKENILHVSVKDEGIGIKEDKLKYIFEAFNQEDSSTARKYGGTGLGLSISSKLVELLGGHLYVKSKFGYGSEFYFDIPIKIGEAVKDEVQEIDTYNILNGIKVLLVEDVKTNQTLMKIILEKVGISVDVANDGLEAVEKFINDKYDCILMDENMPNMNGTEATMAILKYEKDNFLTHTPIIALTANAVKGDKKRFLSVGMDEYLSKPIDKNKIYKMISRFVSKG